MTENELLRLFTHATPTFATAEDVEIVDRALIAADLLGNDGIQWLLTDRGRVFVDHVCALRLPEQVTIWAVAPIDVRPSPMRPVRQPATLPIATDEGLPPKPAPPAKRINGVQVPDDPEQKRAMGLQLMNNGMGVAEVAELMGLTFPEVDGWFTGK